MEIGIGLLRTIARRRDNANSKRARLSIAPTLATDSCTDGCTTKPTTDAFLSSRLAVALLHYIGWNLAHGLPFLLRTAVIKKIKNGKRMKMQCKCRNVDSSFAAFIVVVGWIIDKSCLVGLLRRNRDPVVCSRFYFLIGLGLGILDRTCRQKSEPVRHLSTSDSTAACIALGISFPRKSLLFFINSPFFYVASSLFVAVVDCWWINSETVWEYQMRCWLTKNTTTTTTTRLNPSLPPSLPPSLSSSLLSQKEKQKSRNWNSPKQRQKEQRKKEQQLHSSLIFPRRSLQLLRLLSTKWTNV